MNKQTFDTLVDVAIADAMQNYATAGRSAVGYAKDSSNMWAAMVDFNAVEVNIVLLDNQSFHTIGKARHSYLTGLTEVLVDFENIEDKLKELLLVLKLMEVNNGNINFKNTNTDLS